MLPKLRDWRAARQKNLTGKAVDNGCLSNAILGRALLAEGKLKDAQTVTDLAQSLCQRGQDRGAKFLSAMAGAEVKFKAGSVAEAMNMLDAVHADSVRNGYVTYELESRLLTGEVEVNSGRKTAGRSRLEGVEKDAQSKNFALIARQAHAALGGAAFEF